MTAYFIGDIPAEALTVEPARAGLAINLALFTAATVTVRDPLGATVTPAPTATIVDADTLSIQWPTTSLFALPGVYVLSINLTGTGTRSERLSPVRVVSQAVADGWYTLDELRDDWQDAPDEDILCFDLLEVAKTGVIDWAPAEDAGINGFPPYHWRKAQLMHARTLWNADKGDAADTSMGLGGLTITPKSLERNTKDVLRPKTPIRTV